jgi:prophage maintenance system killer protein
LFLRLNNCRLEFVAAEAVAAVEALAAGSLDETAVAAWFRAQIAQGGV